MPVKTRQPAASTLRVRQTRARKKIAQLRKDPNWLAWVVRQFYIGHDIEISSWVMADELFDAEVTDKNIRVSLFLPNKEDFIRNLKDSPAIETATLRAKTEDITLVRPRYLRNEVLSI
jgi:hypothetical protein